jgi:hypothetical protein
MPLLPLRGYSVSGMFTKNMYVFIRCLVPIVYVMLSLGIISEDVIMH